MFFVGVRYVRLRADALRAAERHHWPALSMTSAGGTSGPDRDLRVMGASKSQPGRHYLEGVVELLTTQGRFEDRVERHDHLGKEPCVIEPAARHPDRLRSADAPRGLVPASARRPPREPGSRAGLSGASSPRSRATPRTRLRPCGLGHGPGERRRSGAGARSRWGWSGGAVTTEQQLPPRTRPHLQTTPPMRAPCGHGCASRACGTESTATPRTSGLGSRDIAGRN